MIKRTQDLYRRRELQCDNHLTDSEWNALTTLAGMKPARIGHEEFVTGRDFCESVERLAAITAAI